MIKQALLQEIDKEIEWMEQRDMESDWGLGCKQGYVRAMQLCKMKINRLTEEGH